jgi:hypothetical protein
VAIPLLAILFREGVASQESHVPTLNKLIKAYMFLGIGTKTAIFCNSQNVCEARQGVGWWLF